MPDSNPYESSLLHSPDSPSPAPTRARYVVLGLSIAMAILLYLDRFALNVMQPVVMQELDISKSQMGLVTGAFFWAYALAQVPAGSLGDRLGARLTLALYVAAWSLAFAVQAVAVSLTMLIVFRALQGIAQAGAYAVTASYLKHWIEPYHRGFANSSVSMGGRAGGVLTNFITPRFAAFLAPALVGVAWWGGETLSAWRAVFLVYAALGLIWAVVFWLWFRDRPEQHASVNAAELAIIRGPQAKSAVTSVTVAPTPGPSFWTLLANRNLWLLSGIMFFVNVGWIFLSTSQTTYLSEVFKFKLETAGTLTAFTTLAGMTGCITGGLATDWFVRLWGVHWGRRLPGMVSCGGAALLYLVAMQLDSPWAVVGAFACVYFFNDFLLGALWSAVQEVGGRHAGAMFGFINMSGNLGAAIFPYVMGLLLESEGLPIKPWTLVIGVSASAFLISFTLWFFVDPRIKLPEHAAA